MFVWLLWGRQPASHIFRLLAPGEGIETGLPVEAPSGSAEPMVHAPSTPNPPAAANELDSAVTQSRVAKQQAKRKGSQERRSGQRQRQRRSGSTGSDSDGAESPSTALFKSQMALVDTMRKSFESDDASTSVSAPRASSSAATSSELGSLSETFDVLTKKITMAKVRLHFMSALFIDCFACCLLYDTIRSYWLLQTCSKCLKTCGLICC